MNDIFLTGIKPTGDPHIGNYFGAIKPAVELSDKNPDAKCFYFIADYHALTTAITKEELQNYTYQVAATWLASGLDPEKVVFYKQSDIAEIFQLSTILSNFTPKGLMNRAHAYKAITDENIKNNLEVDGNVNMGLFNYPILMASDILIFNANKVPVGKDQKQHIEIARDIAQAFNSRFGKTFILPEPLISENVATVIGLDGRKMSKSYNNTIKLFSSEKELEKTIKRIITDSKGVDDPKGKDNAVFDIYKLFATPKQLAQFEKSLKVGIGWGEAKKQLFELVNHHLTPLREKYNYYIENKQLIDKILEKGAETAKQIAQQTLTDVKKALGVI